MSYSIAIDGPAGAGKSTIAKLLASKLNYIYVDTGAMYRAMAVHFSKNNVNPLDENEVNSAVQDVDIQIQYDNGVQQVILNGENVTGLLRTEETGKMASQTSKYQAVRTKLVDLQRKLSKTSDVIMEGILELWFFQTHSARYILLQVLRQEQKEDIMNWLKRESNVILNQ